MSEASDVYLTRTIPPSSGLGLNKSAVGSASVFLLRHQPENLEAPPWKPRVSPTVLLMYEQQWLHNELSARRGREVLGNNSFAGAVLGDGGVTWVNNMLEFGIINSLEV